MSITLQEASERIGDGVVYRPHPEAPAEDGIITEVTRAYVMVRYSGDTGSKATMPGQLTFLADVIS